MIMFILFFIIFFSSSSFIKCTDEADIELSTITNGIQAMTIDSAKPHLEAQLSEPISPQRTYPEEPRKIKRARRQKSPDYYQNVIIFTGISFEHKPSEPFETSLPKRTKTG